MAVENYQGFSVISDVGTTANSYVSVADTKTHWDLDTYKKDYTYSDTDIGRAVIRATASFDSQYWDKYRGTFYDNTYALHFPRVGLYDSRGIALDDYTAFPSEVAKAVAIQAWYELEADRAAEAEVSAVKKLEMDGLGSKEFFDVGSQMNNIKTKIHEEANAYMEPYVISSSSRYGSIIGRG